MIPRGPAFFSLKAGVPMIPIFFFRRGDGHFEIKVYPPIEPPHLADGKITHEATQEYTQKYLTAIEQEIRENPHSGFYSGSSGSDENSGSHSGA